MGRIHVKLSIYCLISLSLVHADHFPQAIGVLGDDFSDSGNSRPSQFGTPSTTSYAPLTDGTTWPVLLAEKLDAKTLKPSIQGGKNYAYVGALTNSVYTGFPNPSLTSQEQTLSLGKHDPVFVFGGINDIFYSTASDPGTSAAVNISNILDDLHHRHYDRLIVFNLPDVGQFPSAGASSATYTQQSLQFNSTLVQELKDKDYSIIGIDLYTLFQNIFANPEEFGLANSTSAPALTDPTAGYVFWYNGTDPTEATQRLIADYAFSVLSGAECYATLADMPFAVLREQRTSLHQQLAPMQHYHQKFFLYPFISGSYSPLLLPPLSDSCEGNNAHGGDITAGFTMEIWGRWTVGAAGSYATIFSKCHESKNRCEFDLDTGILSLFAGCSQDHGYINGIFNAAWLNYDKVKRTFYTGPYRNRTHGHTSGMDYDAELYGSYYIWAYPQTKIIARSHFKTGPLFEMNYQRVFVDGYREKGADFGNLEYKDQANTLFSTGLGWEALLDFNLKSVGLLMDFHLAANRQWLGKKRYIHFHETSLSGTNGSWPVRFHRNTFASGGLDVSLNFPKGAVFSLGYSFNIGTVDMSEQFLTSSITFPLGKKKLPKEQIKIMPHEGL